MGQDVCHRIFPVFLMNLTARTVTVCMFCTIPAFGAQKKNPARSAGLLIPEGQDLPMKNGYFTFTSMSFGFASSALGSVSVKTPSLYCASILSTFNDPGTVNDRSKEP